MIVTRCQRFKDNKEFGDRCRKLVKRCHGDGRSAVNASMALVLTNTDVRINDFSAILY